MIGPGLVLAGCLASSASTDAATEVAAPAQPEASATHGLREVVPFEVAGEDGTKLRGHVLLPDRDEPLATVLELSPYWNTAYGRSDTTVDAQGGRTVGAEWLRPFLSAGFAVALVNVRGTGASDGCMQWGSPVDWSDAHAVVQGLAQQPWSNGRVGMFGLSYPGWTQYLAIAGAPPALKAVIPASGIIDLYSLTIYNGAPGTSNAYLRSLYTAGTAWGAFAPLAPTQPGGPFVPETQAGHAACARFYDDLRSSLYPSLNGDRTPAWDVRDLRARIARTDVAIFATNGLGPGEGHDLQFEGLWDLMPQARRLMLGQWGHAFPHECELEGADRCRKDFHDLAVGWFDHYLRDGPKTVETGIVEYQDDALQWHTADRWPPRATPARLRLSAGTLVADDAAVAPSTQSFASVDTTAELLCSKHHAVYVSPPFEEDVLLAGNFVANVTLTNPLPGGNFVAFLWRIPPGEDPCLSESVTEIKRAPLDLRHWEGTGHGRDFPTNTPTLVSARSIPFASVIPKGARIALTLQGGSGSLLPDPLKPVIASQTGPGITAELTLPVVEGQVRLSPTGQAAAPGARWASRVHETILSPATSRGP